MPPRSVGQLLSLTEPQSWPVAGPVTGSKLPRARSPQLAENNAGGPAGLTEPVGVRPRSCRSCARSQGSLELVLTRAPVVAVALGMLLGYICRSLESVSDPEEHRDQLGSLDAGH